MPEFKRFNEFEHVSAHEKDVFWKKARHQQEYVDYSIMMIIDVYMKQKEGSVDDTFWFPTTDIVHYVERPFRLNLVMRYFHKAATDDNSTMDMIWC
ncbi:unnamed protein product [Ambrosiozyma monospora]|uniref:Unnamed protein product n=1 Tax=Ambrosiozyma monospora TaxID=43982 RepID=A0ACB5T7S0_AMBMO|nr:unnamed protein product [Ambrosiozyma monospora]